MKRRHYLSVVALVAIVGVAALAGGRFRSESAEPATDRAVYVVAANAGDVIRIDPATERVTETIDLKVGFLSGIAIAGRYLYYSHGGPGIGRYDLRSGRNESRFIDERFTGGLLRTSPKQPGVLFVGYAGLSPAVIQKWSVPEHDEKPEVLAVTEHGPMGSNLGDFEISADGTKLWTASGSPYDFLELNASDLRLSGQIFPAVPYPSSVDTIAVGTTEYLLGGTSSLEQSVHLYRADDPATGVHYDTGEATTSEDGAVALSPDASTIYRVTSEGLGEDAAIETLSADTGEVLETTPVELSESFFEGIAVDPVSGKVFVSLQDAVGVLGPDGTLLETIPGVAGAAQVLVAPLG